MCLNIISCSRLVYPAKDTEKEMEANVQIASCFLYKDTSRALNAAPSAAYLVQFKSQLELFWMKPVYDMWFFGKNDRHPLLWRGNAASFLRVKSCDMLHNVLYYRALDYLSYFLKC